MNTDILNQKPHKTQSGFTLIELSIVIVIIGLMVAGFLQAYKIYDEKQKVERMNHYMVNVAQALNNFPTLIDPATIDLPNGDRGDIYGRMPCPAPLDGTAFGNTYSDEQNPPATTVAATNANCAGTLPVATAGGLVFIGKLPATALKLPNSFMKDTFGNYVMYAVGAEATSDATYSAAPALITIQEKEVNPANGVIRRLGDKSAQYAFISAGSAGVGALDFSGAFKTPCDLATDEGENCIDAGNFANPNNDATFLLSVRGDRDTALFYDDHVQYEAALPRLLQSAEPAECEQQDIFVTQGSCPTGWEGVDSIGVLAQSRTSNGGVIGGAAGVAFSPTAVFGSGNDSAGQYYNEDPDTGDYYFTPVPTDETQGGDVSGPEITCAKEENNQKKTKCFTQQLTASFGGERTIGTGSYDPRISDDVRENLAETCPEGFRPVNVIKTGERWDSNHAAGWDHTYHITCGR